MTPTRFLMEASVSALTPARSAQHTTNFLSALIVTAQNGFGRDVEPFLALSHETWDEEVLWDAIKDLPQGAGRRTRLMWVARVGCLPRLRWLIARGASVALCDTRGRTALWWAARGGCRGAVAELLARGADANGVGVGPSPPLRYEARFAATPTPLPLREAHQVPLLAAVAAGHEDAALALLAARATLERICARGTESLCAPAEVLRDAIFSSVGITRPVLEALYCLVGVECGAVVTLLAWRGSLNDLFARLCGSWAPGTGAPDTCPRPRTLLSMLSLLRVPPGQPAFFHVWLFCVAAACLRCGEPGADEVLLAARRAGTLGVLLPACAAGGAGDGLRALARTRAGAAPRRHAGYAVGGSAPAPAPAPALTKAVAEGRCDIVRALLRAGADVGEEQLERAAAAAGERGGTLMLETLLLTAPCAAAAAPPPARPAPGALLIAAATAGSVRLLRALLAGGAGGSGGGVYTVRVAGARDHSPLADDSGGEEGGVWEEEWGEEEGGGGGHARNQRRHRGRVPRCAAVRYLCAGLHRAYVRRGRWPHARSGNAAARGRARCDALGRQFRALPRR